MGIGLCRKLAAGCGGCRQADSGTTGVKLLSKLLALVYDILPSRRKVPESDARSVVAEVMAVGIWFDVFGVVGRCL